MEKKLAELMPEFADPDIQEAVIELLTENKNINLDLDNPIAGHKAKWHYLHAACVHSSTEVVQLLLDGKANPNCQSSKGNTPLHLVIPHIDDQDGKRNIEMLMEAGADISITSYLKGETPEDLIKLPEDKSWIANLKRSTAGKVAAAKAARDAKSDDNGLFEVKLKESKGDIKIDNKSSNLDSLLKEVGMDQKTEEKNTK